MYLKAKKQTTQTLKHIMHKTTATRLTYSTSQGGFPAIYSTRHAWHASRHEAIIYYTKILERLNDLELIMNKINIQQRLEITHFTKVLEHKTTSVYQHQVMPRYSGGKNLELSFIASTAQHTDCVFINTMKSTNCLLSLHLKEDRLKKL